VPEYKNILIAVDFSNACKQVIQKGINTGKLNQAAIYLIHVVEHLPPIDFGYEPMSNPDWYDNEAELLSQAKKKMDALASEHNIPAANTQVIAGSPKHEIIEYTVQNNIDLLVIGSHGRHGLQRLLGSTAYPILHNAPCDVLAVRIKNQPA